MTELKNISGVLFYGNNRVETNGKTLKGTFYILVSSIGGAYISYISELNDAIDDFIACANGKDFDLTINKITF